MSSVIIGASGSDILRALVSVGQQYHVPVFAFAGEADDMTGSRFEPALFRVCIQHHDACVGDRLRAEA